ncbi:IS110 family transposase [Bacteroides cellulosilyticus]|uniref:IS110 family transposase n=1 Tax=Bacteroides cellulosilyticus TaxID=246787 RepID=UPI0032C17A8C
MKKDWFIGIDISKKTLDVVLYSSSKKHSDEETYLKVSNDSDGFKEIFSWLKKKRITSRELVIGMENMGIYGFDLRLYLESKQVDYCAFMPLDLKLSLGLIRGKNDKVDAERIAYYTWLHRDELHYSRLSDSSILRLQELAAERKRFVKQLAEYESLLTESKDRSKTASYNRAEKAKTFLEEEIKEVEKEMQETIERDPVLLKNYALLLSIKGIGSVNTISTIVHTNNFEGFETARQYACYLGIAPFEHTSGTTIKGKPKVSHIGAKLLKADLSQAAKSAVVWDREMKMYYERKIKEGKAYGVVLNAVKFKLVCRMFAVVRRGTPFVDLQTYKN